MRLWSLHPRYLDSRGLVALWREALLAQKVLQGRTRGYRHHPQLARFKSAADPIAAIASYLRAVHDEASARGFSFDRTKIAPGRTIRPLPVTRGQLAYEFGRLLAKLRTRDPKTYSRIMQRVRLKAHPLFLVVPGDVEPWEKQPGKASSNHASKLL